MSSGDGGERHPARYRGPALDADAATWVLSGLAGFFTALAVLYLVVLRGPERPMMSALAASGALLLGAGAVWAWRCRRRGTRPPAFVGVLAFLPVVNSLVPLAVTAQLHQTTSLLLVLVGIGACVTSPRFALAAGVTAVAGWVAVVLTTPALHTDELGYYAVQLGTAAMLGVLLHVTLRRRRQGLSAARDELAAVAQRFLGVFRGSPIGIGLADDSGRFVAVNPALCRLLGRPDTDLLGSGHRDFLHPADRASWSADESGADVRFQRADGSVGWGWVTLSRTDTAGTLVQLQDVTDRHEAEQALRDSERLLAAVAVVGRRIRSGEDARSSVITAVSELAGADDVLLMEPAGAGLAVTASADGRLAGARVPLDQPSMTADVYRTGEAVFLADPADNPQVSAALLARTAARSALWQPVVAGGHVVGVLAVGWAQRVASVDDRRARAVGMLADETALALEHERLLHHLEQMAYTDTLTGLANRRAWQDQLPRLVSQARRTGRPLTVALADLDRFKRYNDTHGHPAGDDLLRRAAYAFTAALRDSDLLARWGGEEFAMALPDCPATDAAEVLDRVRLATPDDESCSIGFATWDGAESVEELLERADEALYQAKRDGRNVVRRAASAGVLVD